MDISEEAINHAKNTYVFQNLEFKVGSVEKLQFADNSIDVIISFETIEHVESKIQCVFLNEIKRVLKKDGILIISSPNQRVATDLAWELWKYKNPYHIKEFYISEFKRFLEMYFPYVRLFFQRYESVLLLSNEDTQSLKVDLYKKHNFEHAQNIIAICTQENIEESLINSIVLEKDQEYIISQRRIAGLRKQRDEYKETNERLKEENNLLMIEVMKLKEQLNGAAYKSE